MSGRPEGERAFVWRVDQYRGQKALDVGATQLESHGVRSRPERQRVLREWIEFFSSGPTGIRQLNLVSRVPQELLDAIAGQTQLEAIHVKWGPYSDLTPLSALQRLESLSLGGATSVQRVDPILGLPALRHLAISQANGLADASRLGELSSLRTLTFGNASMGSDTAVVLADLRWVTTLTHLESLHLPGIRLVDPDLSPILAIPGLTHLALPLRRQYRKQVMELAGDHLLFAELAAKYREHEAWVATLRAR